MMLCIVFLAKVKTGISMNKITIRQPTKICWSDSCPFGISDFLLSRRAWRIRIPDSSPIYGLDFANNVLEFLGVMVIIWLVLIECNKKGSKQERILRLGDNTSAIGWLFKSSELSFDSRHRLLQHSLAHRPKTRQLRHQHIQGDKNTVSDLLSFAGDTRGEPHPPLAPNYPSDHMLTTRFHSLLGFGCLKASNIYWRCSDTRRAQRSQVSF